MFSLPISAINKNGLIDIFETLAQFPNMMMMIRTGDYTVDAHSLIGVFSLDINKPIELLLEEEPDEDFKTLFARFVPASVVTMIYIQTQGLGPMTLVIGHFLRLTPVFVFLALHREFLSPDEWA